MGVIYDELLREWRRAGGKLFVAFSAPRIYSWYGSWGIKEHIRQPRSEAPKYDALLRFLDDTLHPKQVANTATLTEPAAKSAIAVAYAKAPYQIWDTSKQQAIQSQSNNTNLSDISANWQANWDSKHLYFSIAVTDESIAKGDEILLTLDASNSQINASNSATDKKSDEKNGEESREENDQETRVKTFTFTPFDSLGSLTQFTKTDSGYLFNVALPWSVVPYFSSHNVQTGNKLGINIKVTDVDDDEKGSQSIYLIDGNYTLPEIEFKHRTN